MPRSPTKTGQVRHPILKVLSVIHNLTWNNFVLAGISFENEKNVCTHRNSNISHKRNVLRFLSLLLEKKMIKLTFTILLISHTILIYLRNSSAACCQCFFCDHRSVCWRASLVNINCILFHQCFIHNNNWSYNQPTYFYNFVDQSQSYNSNLPAKLQCCMLPVLLLRPQVGLLTC